MIAGLWKNNFEESLDLSDRVSMLYLLKPNNIIIEINTLIKKKYVDEFYDKAKISNH